MWNFNLVKALMLWVQAWPLLLIRLAVYGGIALGLALAALAGTSVARVSDTADPALGGLVGLGLGIGLMALLRDRLLYLVDAPLIALMVDLLDGRQVRAGTVAVARSRAAVVSRFGARSDLAALDRLIRGVTEAVPAVAGAGGLLVPVLGRLTSGRLLDQIALAHAYRSRPENAWEAAHDGLVLLTQNARAITRTASWINGIGWVVTALLFFLLLRPLSAAAPLWPGTGLVGVYVMAALAAWAVRSALVQPLALACLWQAFQRIVAGQEPLGEWRGRLTQASAPFRHLGEHALTWVPKTAADA